MSNSEQGEKKGVFGTKEWAAHNENCMNGCAHDCKYCYAKQMAVQYKRRTPDTWRVEEPKNYRKKLSKKEGTIMYPTTHDITPTNLQHTIQYLSTILEPGNDVLIVSKPHLSCIKEICDEFECYKNNILFRFTVGSADSETLRFWEPFAPSFEERVEALKYAFEKGYKTSISCEPMLDERIDLVVDAVSDFVTDSIWLGKMNSAKARITMNGEYDADMEQKLGALMEHQENDANMFDLYKKYKDNPKIKWKESIKRVVGIDVPTEKGLDI